jgi:hypothetical protein
MIESGRLGFGVHRPALFVAAAAGFQLGHRCKGRRAGGTRGYADPWDIHGQVDIERPRLHEVQRVCMPAVDAANLLEYEPAQPVQPQCALSACLTQIASGPGRNR